MITTISNLRDVKSNSVIFNFEEGISPRASERESEKERRDSLKGENREKEIPRSFKTTQIKFRTHTQRGIRAPVVSNHPVNACQLECTICIIRGEGKYRGVLRVKELLFPYLRERLHFPYESSWLCTTILLTTEPRRVRETEIGSGCA